MTAAQTKKKTKTFDSNFFQNGNTPMFVVKLQNVEEFKWYENFFIKKPSDAAITESRSRNSNNPIRRPLG